MSTTRLVVCGAKKLTGPLGVPAGTIAAVARTVPSREFSVDTPGCACPVGHAVKNPRKPLGTTVTLNEYAAAVAGTPHGLDWMGKLRLPPPGIAGPPNVPLALRVSKTRQGVN